MSDAATKAEKSNPAVDGFSAFYEEAKGSLMSVFTDKAAPAKAIEAGRQAFSKTAPEQVAAIDCEKPPTLGNQKAYMQKCM